MVNTMELRDIEYFAVMAEHGNVRRAAEALGLSPPARGTRATPSW